MVHFATYPTFWAAVAEDGFYQVTCCASPLLSAPCYTLLLCCVHIVRSNNIIGRSATKDFKIGSQALSSVARGGGVGPTSIVLLLYLHNLISIYYNIFSSII